MLADVAVVARTLSRSRLSSGSNACVASAVSFRIEASMACGYPVASPCETPKHGIDNDMI